MKKKVVIFGAGYHGRNVLRACKYKKIQAITVYGVIDIIKYFELILNVLKIL